MTYNIDAIKDKVWDYVTGKGDDTSYYWEDVEAAFTEDEVEVMREYLTSSEFKMCHAFTNEKSTTIYNFMRQMAFEYVADDELGLAEDIIHWLNN
jgi:hypothetical protein